MTDIAVRGIPIAQVADEIERLCDTIDSYEDDLPKELISRFMEVKLDLSDRVDVWIRRLDSVKSRIGLLKEMKARIKRAINVAETAETGMKNYLKFSIGAEKVPFKGSIGTIYLHRNPKGIDVDIATREVTIYKAVEKHEIERNPGVFAYCQERVFYQLDTDKIKAALDAGTELPWARISQGSHVRIKG